MSDLDDFKPQDPDRGDGGGFLKYCLICCGLFLVMLIVLGGVVTLWFQGAMIKDPVKVEQNLLTVLDCTIPRGYHGLFGVNAMGAKGSALVPDRITLETIEQESEIPLVIVAFQMPAGATKQQTEQQIRMLIQKMGGGRGMQIESQETITLKVRGQDVQAEKVVGLERGKRSIRVLTTIDKSASDPTPVSLLFAGSVDSFDQAAMDSFLNSIK